MLAHFTEASLDSNHPFPLCYKVCPIRENGGLVQFWHLFCSFGVVMVFSDKLEIQSRC